MSLNILCEAAEFVEQQASMQTDCVPLTENNLRAFNNNQSNSSTINSFDALTINSNSRLSEGNGTINGGGSTPTPVTTNSPYNLSPVTVTAMKNGLTDATYCTTSPGTPPRTIHQISPSSAIALTFSHFNNNQSVSSSNSNNVAEPVLYNNAIPASFRNNGVNSNLIRLHKPDGSETTLSASAPAAYYTTHGLAGSFNGIGTNGNSAFVAGMGNFVVNHQVKRRTHSSSETSNFDENEQIKRSGSLSQRSGTREVHNKLEKNRRAHLKECFDMLKSQLPPPVEEKKTSNLNILASALRHIQVLKWKEREYEHEMERLAREKISHQQKLGELKRDLSRKHENIDFNKLLPSPFDIPVIKMEEQDEDDDAMIDVEQSQSAASDVDSVKNVKFDRVKTDGDEVWVKMESDVGHETNARVISVNRDTMNASGDEHVTSMHNGVSSSTTNSNSSKHFVSIPATIVQSSGGGNQSQQVLVQQTNSANSNSTSKAMTSTSASTASHTPTVNIQIPQMINAQGFVVNPTIQLLTGAQSQLRVIQSANGERQLALVQQQQNGGSETAQSASDMAQTSTVSTVASCTITIVSPKMTNSVTMVGTSSTNSTTSTLVASVPSRIAKSNGEKSTNILSVTKPVTNGNKVVTGNVLMTTTPSMGKNLTNFRTIPKGLTLTSSKPAPLSLCPTSITIKKENSATNGEVLGNNQISGITPIVVPQAQLAHLIGTTTPINGKIVTPVMKQVPLVNHQYLSTTAFVKPVVVSTTSASLPPPKKQKLHHLQAVLM